MHGNIVSLVDSTGVPLNKSGILGIVSAGNGGAECVKAYDQDTCADGIGGLAFANGWETYQGFKVSASVAGGILSKAIVSLGKIGSPTGNVQVQVIRGIDFDNPEAESDTINVTSLSQCADNTAVESLRDETFTFDPAYTLEEDDYVVVTTTSTSAVFSGGSAVFVGVGQPTITPTRYYSNSDTGGWTYEWKGGTGTGAGVKMVLNNGSCDTEYCQCQRDSTYSFEPNILRTRIGVRIDSGMFLIGETLTKISVSLLRTVGGASDTTPFYIRIYNSSNTLKATFGEGEVKDLTTSATTYTYDGDSHELAQDDYIVVETDADETMETGAFSGGAAVNQTLMKYLSGNWTVLSASESFTWCAVY